MGRIRGILQFSLVAVVAGTFIGSPFPYQKVSQPSQLEQVCNQEIIDKDKTAIFVIDMQSGWEQSDGIFSEKLIESRSEINWDQKVKNQVSLLEYAKENNIPVYIFELFNNGETLSKLKKELNGTDYQTYLKFGAGVYFECFEKFDAKEVIKADIEEELNSRGIENIIIVGHNKYDCIRRSIYGSHEFGFNVIYSEDLVLGSDSTGKMVEIIPEMPDFVEDFIEKEIADNSRDYGSTDSLLGCLR